MVVGHHCIKRRLRTTVLAHFHQRPKPTSESCYAGILEDSLRLSNCGLNCWLKKFLGLQLPDT